MIVAYQVALFYDLDVLTETYFLLANNFIKKYYLSKCLIELPPASALPDLVDPI